MSSRDQALERIRTVYRRRLRRRDQADARNPNWLALTDGIKWSNYRKMLERTGLFPLGGRDILDIGCQWGTWLALCREEWGQDSKHRLCGIELMSEWVQRSRALYDFMDVHCGSGDRAPFEDESFDLVHQGMVFSSVPGADLREGIASEMRRLVKPGGYTVWYDFFFNPINSDTVDMTKSRVLAYFPGWKLVYRDRVTLAAPLARALQNFWGGGVNLLNRIKVLNFHYLMLIQKPGATG